MAAAGVEKEPAMKINWKALVIVLASQVLLAGSALAQSAGQVSPFHINPLWLPLLAVGTNTLMVGLREVTPNVPDYMRPFMQVGVNVLLSYVTGGATTGNWAPSATEIMIPASIQSALSYTMHNVSKNVQQAREERMIDAVTPLYREKHNEL
jgi:hypothetical protein